MKQVKKPWQRLCARTLCRCAMPLVEQSVFLKNRFTDTTFATHVCAHGMISSPFCAGGLFQGFRLSVIGSGSPFLGFGQAKTARVPYHFPLAFLALANMPSGEPSDLSPHERCVLSVVSHSTLSLGVVVPWIATLGALMGLSLIKLHSCQPFLFLKVTKDSQPGRRCRKRMRRSCFRTARSLSSSLAVQ